MIQTEEAEAEAADEEEEEEEEEDEEEKNKNKAKIVCAFNLIVCVVDFCVGGSTFFSNQYYLQSKTG